MNQLMRRRPKRLLCCLAVCFLFLLTALRTAPMALWGNSRTAGERTGPEYAAVTAEGRLERKAVSRGKLIYYVRDIRLRPEDTSVLPTYSDLYFSGQNNRLICYPERDEAKIGSRIVAKGRFMPFSRAENEGQFDAFSYYGMNGFCGSITGCRIMILSDGGIWGSFMQKILQWKWDMRLFLYEHMEREDASVLSAMLLGDKGDTDRQIKSMYVGSGIAHILAISGLHISLIGMTLYRLLRRGCVPPPVCAGASVAAVLLYGLLAGGSGSVVRAVTMFVLYMAADLLGRSYDSLTGLALAMFIVLIRNPYDLTEAGFLLSFLAVLGISLFLPLMGRERRDRSLSGKLFHRFAVQPFCVSLCVSLMTCPVILWFYHVLTPYSILLNLLVIPLFSVLLTAAVPGVLFRLPALLYAAGGILHVINTLCVCFRRLPFSIYITGRPRLWQVIVYYLAVLCVPALAYRWRRRQKRAGKMKKMAACRRAWGAALLCAGFAVLLLPTRRMDGMDVLSVGQGDCIVLRTADGRCAIVDCGSSSENAVGTYRLIPYLKYNGIRRVDAVIVSHAHEDHVSGISELLENGRKEGIQTSCVLLGVSAKRDGEPGEEVSQGAESERGKMTWDAEQRGRPESREKQWDIAKTARENGCEVRYIAEGDRIRIGSLMLDVLYESSGKNITDENDASVVLLAGWQGLSALLTGDSPQSTDAYVLDRLAQLRISHITCLKVAHHGSSSATSEALLNRLRPQAAVISCGAGNAYGHPHEETLEKLSAANIKIFRTDESGQITVKVKKGRVVVGKFLE